VPGSATSAWGGQRRPPSVSQTIRGPAHGPKIVAAMSASRLRTRVPQLGLEVGIWRTPPRKSRNDMYVYRQNGGYVCQPETRQERAAMETILVDVKFGSPPPYSRLAALPSRLGEPGSDLGCDRGIGLGQVRTD